MDNKINYDEIFNIIKDNFLTIMQEYSSYYENYQIKMATEQQFIKQTELSPDYIYIVIKFAPASMEFGQSVLPLTITAISEENKLDVCQRLFLDMAERFNNVRTSDDTILQLYESPTVSSNFNNVYSGYRSILYSDATFVITRDVNYYTLYFYPNDNVGTPEEIECLHSIFGGDTELDSEVTFASDNFSKSVAKFATNTLNITTYVLNNRELIKKALSVYLKSSSINNNFKIGIKFKYLDNTFIDDYRLANVNVQQQIDEIPIITLTFTN